MMQNIFNPINLLIKNALMNTIYIHLFSVSSQMVLHLQHSV